MVKIFGALLLLVSLGFGNVYEKNCVNCHKIFGPDLKKLFFAYLLKYSSEKRVKKALYEYLKNPDPKKSIMPKEYLKQKGVKKRSKLSDKELKKAIDIYWEKYRVIGRIK